MANKKISALTALGGTPVSGDIIPITDVSDTSGSAAGTTKKVTVTNLMGAAPVQTVNSATGAVSIDAGNLADFNFDGNAILGFDATLNDQTGTAYTLLSTDAGKVVTCNNGSAITLTVPAGLGAGFTCSVVQKGAGQVTFTASSTTINNRQSHTKIAGQHGVATLVATAADVFVLAGDTAS
tara:strand:+ start:678 stop:1220 length:543 start_codon:yes stop_codon:yes gene_type:complete